MQCSLKNNTNTMQQYKDSAKIILAYKKLSENTRLIMFIEGNFGDAIQQPEANISAVLRFSIEFVRILGSLPSLFRQSHLRLDIRPSKFLWRLIFMDFWPLGSKSIGRKFTRKGEQWKTEDWKIAPLCLPPHYHIVYINLGGRVTEKSSNFSEIASHWLEQW